MLFTKAAQTAHQSADGKYDPGKPEGAQDRSAFPVRPPGNVGQHHKKGQRDSPQDRRANSLSLIHISSSKEAMIAISFLASASIRAIRTGLFSLDVIRRTSTTASVSIPERIAAAFLMSISSRYSAACFHQYAQKYRKASQYRECGIPSVFP